MTDAEKNEIRSKVLIVDDERMPYYFNNKGEKVYADIMCNSSGAIRRLNPGQLCEVEVNFIGEQVQEMIQEAKTLKEKENLLFKFIDVLNHDEKTYFRQMYDSFTQTKIVDGVTIKFMSQDSKRAFIEDVEKNGFYIVRPPHKPLVYDDVVHLYEAFPTVKPKDLYIDIFGTRKRKLMRPGVIGFMYMIVLKQNSNKNFSARSTFRVNRSNLPAKDTTKKTNRSSYARTPVRLSEIYNVLASVSDHTLAEYNVFTRSSALGRKSLDRILTSAGNPLKIRKLKIQDNFTNANADILQSRLKSIGIKLNFTPFNTNDGKLHIYSDDTKVAMKIDNYMIVDHPAKRIMYVELFNKFKEVLSSKMWIQQYPGQKYDYAWDQVFKDEDLLKKYEYAMTDDLKDRLKVLTKGQISDVLEEISKSTPGGIPGYPTSTKKKRGGRKSKTTEILEDEPEEEQKEELGLYADDDEDDTAESEEEPM